MTINGTTPLCIASEEGHLEVVKYLIGNGANINQAKTKNGATPLLTASLNGHLDVVKHLIEKKANIKQALTSGHTPLDAARFQGHNAIETYLMEIEKKCCPVCGILGSQRCSRCKNVWYCGKEHQKEDWKAHRQKCLQKN